MAALTPPRPLLAAAQRGTGRALTRRDGHGGCGPRRLCPGRGSSSGCPRSPGGISGRRGESTGRPGGSRRPRYGGPRRVAGPVRSSEPAHGRSQAYRGSFSVCPERLSAFPSTVAGRTCRLDRSAAYPRHIGQVPPQPIGFPRARRCVRRVALVLRRTGSRMRFRVHIHKTPPARLQCTSAPWANTRGCRASRPVRPLSCLDGNGGGDPRGACPGGPGEVGGCGTPGSGS